MINIYIDKNGKLNKNWKAIHKKNPEIINSIDLPYDNKTKISLAINGLTELPKCKTCGAEVKLGTSYCNRKCSANDPSVKKSKLGSTDLDARAKKISKALKGKSTEKTWITRRKKYANTYGFSESGLKSVVLKNKESDHNTCHLPDWLYDANEFNKIYSDGGISSIMSKSGCSQNLAYVLSLKYGLRTKYGENNIPEQELFNYITDMGFAPEKTRKIIPPYELDIYIPEKKLAIEFNGLYWHSSGSKEEDAIKNSHLRKTELCEAQGIQLLHIFENEWNDPVKREIWKSMIAQKLGVSKRIYARKCTIKSVDYNTAKQFCIDNHLQGHVAFQEAVGLHYNNELIELITLGKGRYQNGLELLRMCTLKGYTVVGGASKLLKGREFISYANRRWSTGNVYDKINMKMIRTTPPCDFYIDNGKVYHRSSYMKHLLKDKLKIYDDNLTAVENCYSNGIRRIWDCGNILYSSL